MAYIARKIIKTPEQSEHTYKPFRQPGKISKHSEFLSNSQFTYLDRQSKEAGKQSRLEDRQFRHRNRHPDRQSEQLDRQLRLYDSQSRYPINSLES